MMKRIIFGLLWLCLLFAACSQKERMPERVEITEKEGYCTLQVEVNSGADLPQSYAAHPTSLAVSLQNLTMVIVDTIGADRPILDTTVMHRVFNGAVGKYTFQIPETIDLEKVRFYVLANAYNEVNQSNNLDLTGIEGLPFKELLARKVVIPASQTDGIPYESYLLMNRTGAAVNLLTKTLPPIQLQHLPARVYFDCSSLGGTVRRIQITRVCTTSSLQSLFPGALAVEEGDIYDLEDVNPGILSNGTDYYYLVYPSGKESTLHLNIEMNPGDPEQQKSVILGTLESGKSYRVKILALGLSFQGGISSLPVESGSDVPVVLNVTPNLGSREVTWTSSDESVFTVTPNQLEQNKAVVKGIQAGTATLTATCEHTTVKLRWW